VEQSSHQMGFTLSTDSDLPEYRTLRVAVDRVS
jgi:hypothetical protein